MKCNRLFAFLLSFVMMTLCFGGSAAVFADSGEDISDSYQYFLNTAADSAYVLFGDKVTGKNMSFIDGLEMGIADKGNLLWNEKVNLGGLNARKQYSANTVYLKVDKNFYKKGQTEFLFSIVFYDFGPSEGTFYFEYHSTDGSLKRVTLVKPGSPVGWSVKTVCISDADLDAVYDNGATVRIVNGAYNAFKKVEAANLSQMKEDKKALEMTCLGSETRKSLWELNIIERGDSAYENENLSSECTEYDARVIMETLKNSGKTVSSRYKEKKLSQGELIGLFMTELLRYGRDVRGWCAAAEEIGLVGADNLFLFDDAPSTVFNLIELAYASLTYSDGKGDSVMKKLIASGFYDNTDISTIKNDMFQHEYFSVPKKLPYITVTDNETKRTYHYINYYGTQLIRPYLHSQSWLPDGKRFVCGTGAGNMFIYDTEAQMLTYLDKATPNAGSLAACVAMDGKIYYSRTDNGICSLWRIDPDTFEKEELYSLPQGAKFINVNVTNDSKYASLDVQGDSNYTGYERPEGTYPIVRVNLETGKAEHRYYSFDYSNLVNHFQINPQYPNLMFFAHETVTSDWEYTDITNRVNIMDMESGEVVSYNQGVRPEGKAVQLCTHESWADSGEHLYFCTWPTNTNDTMGALQAVVRINKDGTHRQYFYSDRPETGFNHCFISHDEKFLGTDQFYVSILSTETNQLFPIVNNVRYVGSLNHPYHPHPHIARYNRMMSWGQMHDEVLGVAWLDFTDIAEKEVARGGRTAFGENVERVSYEGLECESNEVLRAGRKCVSAKYGKAIFLDVGKEVADSTDAAVRISFDYYDNSAQPIVLTYTKGVRNINDALLFFNGEMSFERTGTNKWKHAEFVIESGNFENIGKFDTDIKISGGCAEVFISDIKAEKLTAEQGDKK